MELGYKTIVRPLINMAIDCSSKLSREQRRQELATVSADVFILERERYSAQYEASIAAGTIDNETKNVIIVDNVETEVEKIPSSKAVGIGFDFLKNSLSDLILEIWFMSP